MLNTQPIEKQDLTSPSILSVHSIFKTVQGEGIFAGTPAIFIRLAGCNLQCPQCDTDYTNKRKNFMVGAIMDQVHFLTENTEIRLIVITGGEPFRQNLYTLVTRLLNSGFEVQIETNGTLYGDWLENLDSFLKLKFHVVCSPKTGSVNKKLLPFIDAYKYVVSHDSVDEIDGLPILALGHSASPQIARPHPHFAGEIFVQPADSQDVQENQKHLETAIDSCFTHGYTLCIQIHKYIGLE